MINIDDVWKLVHAIEDGSITLTCHVSPQDVYAGDIEYFASNGWKVVVFNDCNEWDYFDSFTSPDGEKLDFDDMPEAFLEYNPTSEVSWLRYGIPGYLQHEDEKWTGIRDT